MSNVSNIVRSSLADPATEMRLIATHSVRGANYWSRRPVTRMDVRLGAFDDVSSADAPWVTEQLQTVLPGLVEHRCSVGERGGFLQRLRNGTYAAHITEHVALELQSCIGYDTGYGRTRGTGNASEYSVVFEHVHEGVGRRVAPLALDVVRRAFAGTLRTVDDVMTELRAVAMIPDAAPLCRRVHAGITGSAGRAEARAELASRLPDDTLPDTIVNIAPADLLESGLPYAYSDIAVILDTTPTDIPARYRDVDRTARLLSVLADAVPRGGIVVCPADAYLIHDIVRDAGRTIQTFAPSDDIGEHVHRAVHAARAASVRAQI